MSISADGNTWYRIDQLGDETRYTLHSILLNQAAAAVGINFNSCFKIKFQQSGIGSREFDDISITATDLPQLTVTTTPVTEPAFGMPNNQTTVSFKLAALPAGLITVPPQKITINWKTEDGDFGSTRRVSIPTHPPKRARGRLRSDEWHTNFHRQFQ